MNKGSIQDTQLKSSLTTGYTRKRLNSMHLRCFTDPFGRSRRSVGLARRPPASFNKVLPKCRWSSFRYSIHSLIQTPTTQRQIVTEQTRRIVVCHHKESTYTTTKNTGAHPIQSNPSRRTDRGDKTITHQSDVECGESSDLIEQDVWNIIMVDALTDGRQQE